MAQKHASATIFTKSMELARSRRPTTFTKYMNKIIETHSHPLRNDITIKVRYMLGKETRYLKMFSRVKEMGEDDCTEEIHSLPNCDRISTATQPFRLMALEIKFI